MDLSISSICWFFDYGCSLLRLLPIIDVHMPLLKATIVVVVIVNLPVVIFIVVAVPIMFSFVG